MQKRFVAIALCLVIVSTIAVTSAASAAVVKPRETPAIEGKLYSIDNSKDNTYVIFDKNVGKITIDKASAVWAISVHDDVTFRQGHYNLGVTTSGEPLTGFYPLDVLTVDENGHVTTTTGACFNDVDLIQASLANGGRFIIYTQVVHQ